MLLFSTFGVGNRVVVQVHVNHLVRGDKRWTASVRVTAVCLELRGGWRRGRATQLRIGPSNVPDDDADSEHNDDAEQDGDADDEGRGCVL